MREARGEHHRCDTDGNDKRRGNRPFPRFLTARLILRRRSLYFADGSTRRSVYIFPFAHLFDSAAAGETLAHVVFK